MLQGQHFMPLDTRTLSMLCLKAGHILAAKTPLALWLCHKPGVHVFLSTLSLSSIWTSCKKTMSAWQQKRQKQQKQQNNVCLFSSTPAALIQGWGIVEFARSEDAAAAIKRLNRSEVIL